MPQKHPYKETPLPIVKTPSGPLSYRITGQGEPVVIIHGLARAREHWLGFDEELAQHCKVLSFDARGLGESQQDAGLNWSLRIEDLAADVVHLLDTVQWQRAHMFGLSMGGMVALAVAMHHPQRVKTLTLAASSIGGIGLPRLTLRGIGVVFKTAIRRQRSMAALASVLWGPNLTEKKYEKYFRDWDELEKKQLVSPSAGLKQLAASTKFKPLKQLALLKVPTLIMTGDCDRFVPAWNSHTLHRLIPKSQLSIIPGGGHELTTDSREQVIGVLTDFVEKWKG